MIDSTKTARLAIWALTPRGAELAGKITGILPNADLYLSQKCGNREKDCLFFLRLMDTVAEKFSGYDGHIFIMSTGIVIRVLAPLILHKTIDPAVVVMDEVGRHVISLLAGHIGGANQLTKQLAAMIQADPVITTATDINQVPAIDVLAAKRHLTIENPTAIRNVSMALLKGEKIFLHDPYNLMIDALPRKSLVTGRQKVSGVDFDPPGVFIDDIVVGLPPRVLVLRPGTLVAGIGCNRNTPMPEMRNLLLKTLKKNKLSINSLTCIASVNIKKDEKGLLALGKLLKLPILFFERKELGHVINIQNPSAMVEKHIGVKSVCEAAAILAAQNGELAVPKQTSPNVTVAIARKTFTSSV